MEVFDLPFVQRGVWEVLALAVAAGLLGTWIVLRGLAFFAHAAGTAAFPGLVLADGLGFAAALGALGTTLLLAGGVGWLARRDPRSHDALTAIVLVGALAGGVVLASDVFASGAQVEQLLFGSLLLVDGADIALAGAASVVVLLASLTLGPRWLATGFDESSARALGVRGAGHDAVLLGLVALTAVASLSAIGALLTTALLVVPAATTRLVVDRLVPWQLATVALVAAEGVGGLWLSVELNAPPGATIAVLAGVVFALVALLRAAPRRAIAAGAVALLGIGATGCGTGGDGPSDGRVRVVASTTHLADIARSVGGDRVDVRALLPANADPHDYEPRPQDVRAVAEADVLLVSGLGLDDWVREVAERSGGDARLVDVGAGVPHHLDAGDEEHGGDHAAGEHGDTKGEEHDHGDDDPHWWQDPRNVAAAAQAIARATGADAGPYVARVQAADRAVARCIARVPEAQRRIVTDHDAFGYLAARYGLEVVGTVLPSRTTQAQASAGDLAELARTIEREGVRAVFPERQLEPRLARALARRAGVRSDFALISDALGDGQTVLGALAHNAAELVDGMTGGRQRCEVPAR